MKKTKFSGYKVAFGALIVLFVHNGIMGTLGLFLPEISTGLKVPISQVSLGLTISSAVAFIISLFVGKLLIKFSPKYILLLGSITTCLQCFVYGSASSLWILYLGSVIEGFTTGIATTTCIAALIKQWFVEKRSSMIGYVFGGAMLGSALFMTLTGILIQGIGYRHTYYVLGAIAIIIAIPANIIFIKKGPEKLGQKPLGWEKEEEIEAALNAETQNAKGVTLTQATKSPSFWLILLVGTIFAGLSIGFATFVPSFWQEEGMDPVKSAYLITIYSLVATIATIASGKIADKFGNKVFVTYLHLAFIAAMGCAVLSRGNLSPIFVGGSILFAAIAFPIYTTIIPTITSEIFGSLDYEKITGIFMAGLYIGLCLVSPICGYIHDITGSFSSSFIFLGVAALISLICILIALKLSPMKKVSNN
ncbi:MFS family permease [Clostridium algifaecis]|uniref:MFS family permease n=1 Tax=Clostridium algifaecis TaxID=1472040 RepID=A0ABS4KTE8_9CLOT|nr:MFS transporter [Clostridium algifaecis]MBP2033332.1 MFS family permease [Clostridium algifaecis]